nr:uncharacterized protein LOC111419182 isoform X1 [Onthophagus taurus]XP_022907723.1 uncharacterized protein LOC111419182 isoform X2 [Onthophagus taurus]
MSFSLFKHRVLLTFFAASFQQIFGQVLNPHGPPRVDQNPMFLDSFVPASLQLISHVTELMKYEIPATEITPTESAPSTSSHRPGIFAPNPVLNPQELILNKPPSFYYKLSGENRYRGSYLGNTYKSWVHSTRQTGSKANKSGNGGGEEYFGGIHKDLYDKVNGIGEIDSGLSDQEKVERFLKDYDDFENLNEENSNFLRKKKPPPPKAYVSLLSLYDSLNKEAKKLGMNKYAGYTTNVLKDLTEFSKGTSSNQMKQIFTKIVDRREVQQEKVLTTLKTIIKDLDDPKSYMNDALRYIPPLKFEFST